MESLPGDEEVWTANLEYGVERAIMFDRPIGLRSNFYTYFGWSFPRGSYAIATR
jgi:hypothetical protein